MIIDTTQDTMRKKVKAIHDNYGVPYTSIAKKLGLTGSFISQWANGKRNLSPFYHQYITKHFDEFYIMKQGE